MEFVRMWLYRCVAAVLAVSLNSVTVFASYVDSDGDGLTDAEEQYHPGSVDPGWWGGGMVLLNSGEIRWWQFASDYLVANTHSELVNGPGGVGVLNEVTTIGSSDVGACFASRRDGGIWSWGYGNYGQLGNGAIDGIGGDDNGLVVRPVQVIQAGNQGPVIDPIVRFAASPVATIHALGKDGHVWSWGWNGDGNQPTLGRGSLAEYETTAGKVKGPQGAGDFSDVIDICTASEGVAIALRKDGTLWQWGYNAENLWASAYPEQVVDANGQTPITGVKKIAAGYDNYVCLKKDGTVWTSGYNRNGVLGNGWPINSVCPASTQVKGPNGQGFLTDIIDIAVNSSHMLALRKDGTLWIWGETRNQYVNLNTPRIIEFSEYPVQVTGPNGVGVLSDVVGFAVGYRSSMAVCKDGSVYAWGVVEDHPGRYYWPYPQMLNFTALVAPSSDPNDSDTDDDNIPDGWEVQHGLDPQINDAYRDADGDGLMNIMEFKLSTDPQNAQSGPDQLRSDKVVDSSWDAKSSIAVDMNGRVYVWGTCYKGNGSPYPRFTGPNDEPLRVPTMVPSTYLPEPVVEVSAGDGFFVALEQDGDVMAWGTNNVGQVGLGLPDEILVPTKVAGLPPLVRISAGSKHVMGLDAQGNVWTWGGNSRYECGPRDSNPGKVKNIPLMVDLDGGAETSFALDQNGQVWRWGTIWIRVNSVLMSRVERTPYAIASLDGVVAMAYSRFNGYALKGDGTVWVWGSNHQGQFGDGIIDGRFTYTPRQVPSLSGVVNLAAGNEYSLVTRNDGTVWGWGNGGIGQLGNGTYNRSAVPVQMMQIGNTLLTDVYSVFTGLNTSFALKQDGTVLVCGDDYKHQAGDGGSASTAIPLATPCVGLDLSAP